MNAAPVLVALAVAAVAWAIGGSLSGLLFKVAPVSLACLMAATFLWPQRLPGESFAEARVRVRRSLWSDPLTWITLGLVVWNSVALAVLGFVQRAAHTPGPLGLSIGGALPPWKFFSAFGYANFAAAYFTAMLCVALALWAGDVAEGRRFGIPVRAFVLYCAALGTLSRTAIVFAPLAAAAGAVFACVVLVRRIRAGMRGGHWRFLVVAGAVAACAAAFELDGVRGEVAALEPSAVSQRMVDRAQYRRRAAIGLWKDNKLFGCGGLGYMHLCTTKMTAEELKSQEMEGGAFVHNDYLQFLCEHGAVGFGLMAVLLVALLRPFWGGRRRSPAAVFAALGVFAVLLHALWDCPLRCPSVLMTLFGLLAAGRAGEMV